MEIISVEEAMFLPALKRIKERHAKNLEDKLRKVWHKRDQM